MSPGWAIFYDEGRFTDEDGTPAEAPTHGVIAIVQRLQDEAHPQVLHQVDFYWWRDGMWRGGDIFGFLEHAAMGGTWVKQGRTIRTGHYREILGDAVSLSEEWDAAS